jgi:bifunctional non-homologous end joining protein LigD
MPGFIEPCDPTLYHHAPSGPDWVYEIKTDGYRAQVHIRNGEVTIYSRGGYDWTEQFGAIAAAATKLKVRDAIIDGEATVLGTTGLPDFQALRRELAKPESKRLLYHAFDLLYLNGRDLRPTALLDRKQALKSLLRKAPSTIVYVDHIEADGARVFEEACRMGLEGIVAKRGDAPYRSGRQDSWIKLKCVKSDTFPIVAFVEKLGAHPRKIASLYVGRREGQRLLYAGKARSGYTETVARELRERLDPLMRKTSPLSVPVKKPKATWVEPAVDAEIEYSALTDDRLLRAAVFKGLRDDLRRPTQVSRLPRRKSPSLVPQRAANSRSVHGVPRENILQLLPDAVTPPKEELTAYWKKVAKRALVHLGRRPLKLVRHTHGVTFYHRGKLPEAPGSVHQLRIQKREGGEGVRLWVDDLDGLLGLVAMDAVELHPWNATVDDIERADRIVIDLDPGEGVEWATVVETALTLREALRAEGLESWPKLTGGKGLHPMAPLERPMPHDAARQYARSLVQKLAEQRPHAYLLSASPAARRGKIFLDYLRNGRGNTAIGAYSPRAHPNFPIACPISWSQVEKGVRPDAFAMRHPCQGKPRVRSPQQ